MYDSQVRNTLAVATVSYQRPFRFLISRTVYTAISVTYGLDLSMKTSSQTKLPYTQQYITRRRDLSHCQVASSERSSPKKSIMATTSCTVASCSTRTLPNNGSGTLSVTSQIDTTELKFHLMTDSIEGLMILLKVTPERVILYLRQGESYQPKLELSDPNAVLELQRNIKYWVSLDAKSGILRYGKYFPARRLTLLTAFLKPRAAAIQGNAHLVWDGVKSQLHINHAYVVHKVGDMSSILTHTFNPLTVQCDPKPCITPSTCLNMLMIASGEYTVPSSLNPACQELYDHISGSEVKLNDEVFTDFTEAIQHSIKTKDCLVYNMLRQKAVKTAKNRVASREDMAAATDAELRAQYLRITLGCHKVNSPMSWQ